jgi:mono/diheme cytochrome c family protein
VNTSPRIACLLALLTACQEASPKQDVPPTTASAQIEHGARVFAANCAKCHGDGGQGTEDAPPLVGKEALPLHPRPDQKLRTTSFHTVMDVANFATKEMPPKANDRAKLTTNDYWAVLAFDLNANGIALKQPVGPESAASIVLHP